MARGGILLLPLSFRVTVSVYSHTTCLVDGAWQVDLAMAVHTTGICTIASTPTWYRDICLPVNVAAVCLFTLWFYEWELASSYLSRHFLHGENSDACMYVHSM